MKKRVRISNLVFIIIAVLIAIIIVFSVIKPFGEPGFLELLKGELATLRPGEIVQEGLVAYYPFDGNARDAVGVHNGQVHGASLTKGVYGQAYEFDGSGDYIYGSPDYLNEDYINIPFKRGDELDFSNKEEITTSFWMNLYDIPSNNDGGSRPLYWEAHSKYYGDDRIEWFVKESRDETYTVSWRIISQPMNISKAICSKNIHYNEWHMFTGTYNGNLARVYVDGGICGAAYAHGTIYPTTSGDDWVVSDATPDKKLGIVGRMDELRIYNRALSGSEISLLYLGGLDLEVKRDIEHNFGNYYVTLNINRSYLMDNEIMIITEKVPDGASIVQGSWNVEPAYVFDDTLVWLLASNPPVYYGYMNVSQEIPSSLTYTVSGTGGEFKGKWGLKVLDIDGFVIGESTL